MQTSAYLISTLTLLLSYGMSEAFQATRLRVQYSENPQGVTETAPLLSWEIQSNDRGVYQSAYQIHVGTQPGGSDLWNSGWVDGDRQNGIPYNGSPFRQNQVLYWSVNLKDSHGKQSGFSPDAKFESAILRTTDWRAKAIAYPGDKVDVRLMPMFRKAFL